MVCLVRQRAKPFMKRRKRRRQSVRGEATATKRQLAARQNPCPGLRAGISALSKGNEAKQEDGSLQSDQAQKTCEGGSIYTVIGELTKNSLPILFQNAKNATAILLQRPSFMFGPQPTIEAQTGPKLRTALWRVRQIPENRENHQRQFSEYRLLITW
jgi:hypothetical protein